MTAPLELKGRTLTNSFFGYPQIRKWMCSLNSHRFEVSKNGIGCQNRIPQFHYTAIFAQNCAIFRILNAAAIFPRPKILKSFWFNWENFWCTFREGITCWGFSSSRSKILDLKIQENAKKCWFSTFLWFS